MTGLLPEQPYDDARIPLLDLRDKIRHDWNLPSLGEEVDVPAYLEPPPKPVKTAKDHHGAILLLTAGGVALTWMYVAPPVGVGLALVYGLAAWTGRKGKVDDHP